VKKIENISKKKIFDGNQELLKEELVLNINNQEIVVIPSSFINQPLLELEKEGINLPKIASEEGFKLKVGIIKKYSNEDNLDLYFYNEDNLIIIFSFGEWQSSRYILNLESVWEMEV